MFGFGLGHTKYNGIKLSNESDKLDEFEGKYGRKLDTELKLYYV